MDSIGPTEETSSSYAKSNARRCLIGLCLLYPVTQLAYAIQSSFYPAEAESFGASETEVGVIFASFSVSSLLLSLFAVK